MPLENPEEALGSLLKLVRSLAWSPHSTLSAHTQRSLRNALDNYERAKSRPTAFSRLLADEDPFEQEVRGPTCANCGFALNFKSKRKRYCSAVCRATHWKLNQAARKASLFETLRSMVSDGGDKTSE